MKNDGGRKLDLTRDDDRKIAATRIITEVIEEIGDIELVSYSTPFVNDEGSLNESTPNVVEILKVPVSDFLGIHTYSYPQQIFRNAFKSAEEKYKNKIIAVSCYVAAVSSTFYVYGKMRPKTEIWTDSGVISLEETQVVRSYMLKWDKVTYIKPPFPDTLPQRLGGVDYFRHPNLCGNKICPICLKPYHEHGYLNRDDLKVELRSTLPNHKLLTDPDCEYDKTVCPGDYLWFKLDDKGNEVSIRIMNPKYDQIPEKCKILFR